MLKIPKFPKKNGSTIPQPVEPRRYSTKLVLGMLFLPFAFGWSLFGNGYSVGQRLSGLVIVAFGSLFWLTVIALNSIGLMSAAERKALEAANDIRAAQRDAEEAEEWTTDNSIVTATRVDFENRGLDWPLLVDRARLGCTGAARWAEVEGVKYALNGRAKGQGYEPIEAIWREDEAMTQLIREELESRGANAANEPPIRMNIGDMIAEAGELCR